MAYYLKPKEIAEILDVGYRTVTRWIVDGRFGEVTQTPTRRYKVSWDNIVFFCTENKYPLPTKIPKHERTSGIEFVSVDSEQGQSLLKNGCSGL